MPSTETADMVENQPHSFEANGPLPINGATSSAANGHHVKEEAFAKSIDIPMEDFPAWTPRRKLKIVTVGAGFSGLIFAHKLQHQHPEFQELVEHQIFEARSDIGGTWLVNRYPGVQCDVPAQVYAFPFDPNPNWSHFYATGQEIQDYIKATTKKWNLDRDVKLNYRVMQALWQESIGQWQLTVEHEGRSFTEYTDLLISGQGVLNNWHWPNIEGLNDFKGHKTHSAAWDENYDYSSKTIAVLGNGSSGVQIIPQLANLPNTKLVAFQRTPNYVYTHLAPSLLEKREETKNNPEYSEEERRRFREDPAYLRAYRQKLIHQINSAFKMFLKDSDANNAVTETARKQMAEKLHYNEELCKKLIPDWALGCRRITPGEGYLESLLKPNVQLVTSAVTKADADSVTTADGQNFKVDVIACATGFDVSLKPQWRMIGRHGVDLADEWAVDPESYLSVAARDMPNYFMFLGPNAVIAHGSLLESINWTAEYLLKWIRKMATENIKSVVPKSGAVDELIRYGDRIHKTLIWSGGCSSWFKRNTVNGRVTAAFAGSALLFRQLISELRPEDFEIEYRSPNRWAFLGNGFTEYELNQENDLAWYIEK